MTSLPITNASKPRKVKEARTKKGYWYRCPVCTTPYGDFEKSQAGKIVTCVCGKTLEIKQ